MQLEEIVDKILSDLGLSTTDTLSKKSSILCIDAIYALILGDSIKEASQILEVSNDELEQVLRRHFKDYCNKDSKTKWSIYLLNLVGYAKCRLCNNILNITEFSIDVSKYKSVNTVCKHCDALKNKAYRGANPEAARQRSRLHYINNKADYLARNANRRALKLRATPVWADMEAIKEKYRSCPEGFHVDHEIPLQGDLVCGLHVAENLRHISAQENLQKSNKWEVK